MTQLAGIADLRDKYDLVIIGAGPAGMAAAIEADGHGIAVLVIDENPAPGGQIWRAVTTTPLKNPATLGPDYHRGGAIARAFAATGADYLPAATVWHLDATPEIGVSAGGHSAVVAARHVIIATGALERPFPIEGWTLPGVMSIGAAQTLLKAQGLTPAGKTLLAGTGPLLWLYAAQLLAAGAPPALILDTTPRANWRRALPHLPAFLASPYALKGAALLAKTRPRIKTRANIASLAITAEGPALRARWNGGDALFDTILLHQGVVPHTSLAAAAGCDLAWNDAQACFTPVTNDWFTSSLKTISVAGDGAGIAGAEAATLAGRLAALAALHTLRAMSEDARDIFMDPLRPKLGDWRRGRAFLDALYRPAPQFRIAPNAALACRCEEVTGAQLREAARLGATGPNQVKAMLRCGMGPCQGRYCNLTVTETLAAAHGVSPAKIGALKLRTPIKPITLGEFASLRKSAADLQAVERR